MTPKLASWLEKIIKDKKALSIIEESEERILRAYGELLSGYNTDTSKILNEIERVKEYNGLVVERDIDFTSICGHHFLLFYGKITIAYEPNEVITGLGKIPRLVQAFSRRFQLQELLVKEIAETIHKSIGAKGVYVEAKASHLCMCSRCPFSQNVATICSYGIGSLKEQKDKRILSFY